MSGLVVSVWCGRKVRLFTSRKEVAVFPDVPGVSAMNQSETISSLPIINVEKFT